MPRHYAVLSNDGRVYNFQCSPAEIDRKCDELDGVLITEAETLELFQKRRAQDKNGKTEIW